jgi:3-carboxy-cis,cis-muconate cycloisomerase
MFQPHEAFLSTPAMLGLFAPTALVQDMLDVEAALARAQARVGLVPQEAAQAITACAQASRFDVGALVAASGRAGTLAVPLVQALTAEVRRQHPQAAGFVHWGGTSQDVVDTAMVLATRRALGLIDTDLKALTQALLDLADTHLDTPVLARTLMQPAQVISLGLRLVAWIAPLVRARQRLQRQAAQALSLQFGGAVGTLSSLGEHGPAVAAALAQELSLHLPPGPWHTQRDEWVTLACELGVLCGSLGKIATDLSLMSQPEVGEMSEPVAAGKGGSSAMPHKRNPVACMAALAAAHRAPQRVAALLSTMGQAFERGLGDWQAEGAEWAGLLAHVHGALAPLTEAAGQGLQVHPQRMLANIESLQGLVFTEAVSMQVAHALGKADAHHRVEQWCQQVVQTGRHLRDVAREAQAADPALSALPDLAALCDARLAAEPAARQAQAQLALWRQAMSRTA